MKRTLGLVVVGIMLAPGMAMGQGFLNASHLNWNFLGSGARAEGMGGAYLAVANGVAAGTWNPAGLVYNEGIAFSSDLRVQHASLDLPQTSPTSGGPFGQFVRPGSEDNTNSVLNAASFVAPVMIREHEFYGSVAYRRLQNIFWRTDIVGGFSDEQLDAFVSLPMTAQSSGNLGVFYLNTGTSVTSNMSVGFGVQLYTGDRSDFYQILQDNTGVDPELTEGVDTVFINETADINYGGFGFNFGALYSADRWSAGAVFQPGFTLEEEYDFVSKIISIRRGIVEPEVGIIFVTKREIDVPWTLGLGGSYKLTDNLMIAGDYQFRAFGSGSFSASDSSGGYRTKSDPVEPSSDFEAIPVQWEDLHQIRIGAEFVKETNIGTIPIRAGFRTEPMLIGDQTDARAIMRMADPGERDRAIVPFWDPLGESAAGASGATSGTTLTLGTGIHWSQIRFDVAVAYTMVKFTETGTLILESLDFNQDLTIQELGEYDKKLDDDRAALTVQFTGYF